MTRADKLLLLAYIDSAISVATARTQPWAGVSPELANLEGLAKEQRAAFLDSSDTLQRHIPGDVTNTVVPAVFATAPRPPAPLVPHHEMGCGTYDPNEHEMGR